MFFSKHIRYKGFTLIEMVVVIAIFTLMAGLVLFNFRSFQNVRSLDSVAQELAVTVREAQIYGISVKSIEGTTIFPAYGIYIAQNSPNIIFFADTNPVGGNGVYDPGQDQIVSTFRVENSIVLHDICTSQTGVDPGSGAAGATAGGYKCGSKSGNAHIDNATVIFKRPDPEPTIRDDSRADELAFLRIDMRDKENFIKSVYIWKSGQIAVVDSLDSIKFAATPGSCPFIYSWDGEEWHFDHEAYPSALFSSVETTSWEVLRNLRSVEGEIFLQMREEFPEDSWTDSVKVFAVDLLDISSPVQIMVDPMGGVHTLQNPQKPYSCHDNVEKDCLPYVESFDGNFWSRDLTSVPVENAEDDFVELTFPKPDGAEIIKVGVRTRKTALSNLLSARILDQGGKNNFGWIKKIGDIPYFEEKLKSLQDRFKQVVWIWNKDHWQKIGSIDVGRDRWAEHLIAFSLPLDFSQSDEIKIKTSGIVGIYEIDHVFSDFTPDLPLRIQELTLENATKNGIEDVRESLLSDDRKYLTMTGQTMPRDVVNLKFRDTPIGGGERSYFVGAKGYYILGVSEERSVIDALKVVKDIITPAIYDENFISSYILKETREINRDDI